MEHVDARTAPSLVSPARDPLVWGGLALWAMLATAIALMGIFSIENRFVIPPTILSLTFALVALCARTRRVREFAGALDLRVVILVPTIRAPIGAAFLVLAARGALDPQFAAVGGWGDLVAGGLAPLAALLVSRPRVVFAWNTVALIDILATFATAQRIILFSDHPETMSGLLGFPGALLPLLVVPLVLATHALVYWRLRRDRAPAT